MNPLLRAAAVFAASFMATWWAVRAVMRRRSGLVRYTDAQLRERVQEQVAANLDHPQGVSVSVQTGTVHLSGRVLPRELERLLMRVKDVPGVHRIHNALSVLDETTPAERLAPVAPMP